MTQRQAAERIPMSTGNLSRVEKGEQGPPADEVIDRLARALKLPPEELFALARRATTPSDFEQRVLRESPAAAR
jgi:transcriptional regulator with XRE-family HTH domain